MTRGSILLLPFVLITGALAQAPVVQQPAPIKTPPAVVLSDTEKIALQSVLKEREALGQKLQAIDADVRRAHAGYHLEWGVDSVSLVKDVEAAKPVESPESPKK